MKSDCWGWGLSVWPLTQTDCRGGRLRQTAGGLESGGTTCLALLVYTTCLTPETHCDPVGPSLVSGPLPFRS